jgi:hypothetical protein
MDADVGVMRHVVSRSFPTTLFEPDASESDAWARAEALIHPHP